MTNQPEEQNRKLRELLLKLGLSYLEHNRYQDAFDKLTHLLDLDPKNEQALFLATKAAIAFENVSEHALDLYSRALDANPGERICQELRILLENQQIQSAVASEIQQKLDALHLPAEDNLQETLPKATVEPSPVVEDPQKEFADKIESLCWISKFDEAIKTINDNKELNSDFLQKQLALTHAYQSFTNKQKVTATENIENIHTQIQHLELDSLDSLREIVALMHALPEEVAEGNGKCDDSEESEFILGNVAMEDFFDDLQKKQEKPKTTSEKLNSIIFNELQKAQEWTAESEIINHKWCGFLATSLRTRGNEELPEKIVTLVAAYLFKIPQSVLRFIGNGFLSFAENPLKQIMAVLNLYESINHYNKAAEEGNQITLSSSIVAQQNDDGSILDSQSFQINILKTLHLHKLTKAHSQKEFSLQIECPKTLLTELRQLDEAIKYKPQKKICLLPGVKSECYSIEKQQKEKELKNDSPPEIQDLKILEKLGSHYPFTTYLTKNRQLERLVILKTISFRGKNKNIERQKRTVLSNIKKIGRLSQPNIATLFDLGESNEQIYYTREYVEGESILNLNKSEKGWQSNFLTILEKIIRALQTLAINDISHLNLKPSNIWTNEANTLKLTDFNIYQAISNNKNNSEIKSENYLAPEVIETGKGDSRSDIYSLGLIIYEILTGNSPYKATNDSENNNSISLLLENDDSTLHPDFVKIIRKATQEKPEERFQTLNELEMDVKKLYLELSAQTQEV